MKSSLLSQPSAKQSGLHEGKKTIRVEMNCRPIRKAVAVSKQFGKVTKLKVDQANIFYDNNTIQQHYNLQYNKGEERKLVDGKRCMV